MRFFAIFACLFLLCAAPFVSAQAAQGEAAPIPPAARHIVPHRALYDLNLASVRNGSDITDVSGRMLFQWRDTCTGWAIQQYMKLYFSYAEGDSQTLSSTELTWESKDGKRYTFNVSRATDGKENEHYRGSAILKTDGSGTVTYVLPKKKTVHLPKGALFPTAHTELILQMARAGVARGDMPFMRRVFDGADDEGQSDISAVIEPPQPTAKAGLPEKLRKNPLLAAPAWPVRMAFFKAGGGETMEPDYEMRLDLEPNGIARHMMIDYGDFAINGKLEDVEALPAPHCR
ncbi:MAG: cell envelope integrity EipB family protein [Alphaproteobacteria bacterium]|nr:cell envelope integrity EipB family protein [Alphaproteobacteria bacterium]